MRISFIIKIVLSTVLIIAGITWTILIWYVMFPVTKGFLKPDFVASVAIGIGLVMSGVLVLFFKKSKVLQGVLAILLIWSLLMNAMLLCWARKVVQATMADWAQNTSSPKTSHINDY